MNANIFQHAHRVTYSECTVGNHVYYSRYLDILEEARGEFLRSLGQTCEALSRAGYIFPVVEVGLRYRAPARYDDLLDVKVWVTQLTAVRLAFGYRVERPGGELLVEGTTFHVCTSLHERPTRMPPELATRLREFLVEIEHAG